MRLTCAAVIPPSTARRHGPRGVPELRRHLQRHVRRLPGLFVDHVCQAGKLNHVGAWLRLVRRWKGQFRQPDLFPFRKASRRWRAGSGRCSSPSMRASGLFRTLPGPPGKWGKRGCPILAFLSSFQPLLTHATHSGLPWRSRWRRCTIVSSTGSRPSED